MKGPTRKLQVKSRCLEFGTSSTNLFANNPELMMGFFSRTLSSFKETVSVSASPRLWCSRYFFGAQVMPRNIRPRCEFPSFLNLALTVYVNEPSCTDSNLKYYWLEMSGKRFGTAAKTFRISKVVIYNLCLYRYRTRKTGFHSIHGFVKYNSEIPMLLILMDRESHRQCYCR